MRALQRRFTFRGIVQEESCLHKKTPGSKARVIFESYSGSWIPTLDSGSLGLVTR